MDEMMIFIYGLHSEIMNVLQTEILEEKATTCVLLRDCVAELKEGIDLWIDEVVNFVTHNSFHSLSYLSKY